MDAGAVTASEEEFTRVASLCVSAYLSVRGSARVRLRMRRRLRAWLRVWGCWLVTVVNALARVLRCKYRRGWRRLGRAVRGKRHRSRRLSQTCRALSSTSAVALPMQRGGGVLVCARRLERAWLRACARACMHACVWVGLRGVNRGSPTSRRSVRPSQLARQHRRQTLRRGIPRDDVIAVQFSRVEFVEPLHARR
eukprot:3195455-Pleurochrysis_carterae.AAC.3